MVVRHQKAHKTFSQYIYLSRCTAFRMSRCRPREGLYAISGLSFERGNEPLWPGLAELELMSISGQNKYCFPGIRA